MYLVIKTKKEETPVRKPTTRGRPSTKPAPPPEQEVLAFPTFDALSTYILRAGLENCKVFDAVEVNLKLQLENQVTEEA